MMTNARAIALLALLSDCSEDGVLSKLDRVVLPGLACDILVELGYVSEVGAPILYELRDWRAAMITEAGAALLASR